MLLGDLLTLRQLQVPVKLIVFKNDSLAFVELEMKAAGIVDFGTALDNPNFAKMAEAAGLLGLTAETPEQVAVRIRRALPHVSAERIIVAPDCGLKYLPRDVAFGKMQAMVAGAAIVRKEIEG